MSQDHKPLNHSPKRKNGGGTLLGVFIGLVVGVLIAAGVVWFINKTPLPFQNKGDPKNTESLKASATSVATGSAQNSSEPFLLAGKPGDKAPEKASDKPRFDFYKILPGTEDVVVQPGQPAPQGQNTGQNPGQKPVDPANSPPSEALYLQVGAFQIPADADNLKARLALMGVEASVQQITIPEKGVMHRVRIGPYRGPEDMNKVRSQLAQGGIQASVVRVKEAVAN